MRTGLLFFAGLFGGFSLRSTNDTNGSLSSSSSPTTTNVALAAGLSPRAAHEIEHFKDVGWYKGRRRPFAPKFRNYVLGDIIPLTHDVALFRFLLPDIDDEFHLKPCSTLQARVTYSGGGQDTIQRFYTPVTRNGSKGYFDIIVKRKQGGRMTAHLFGMRVGDVMQFRTVMFKLNYRPNRWDEIGIIAGGTGFTPMLQIINHALAPVEDPYEQKESEEKAASDDELRRKQAAIAASNNLASSSHDDNDKNKDSDVTRVGVAGIACENPNVVVVVEEEVPAAASAAIIEDEQQIVVESTNTQTNPDQIVVTFSSSEEGDEQLRKAASTMRTPAAPVATTPNRQHQRHLPKQQKSTSLTSPSNPHEVDRTKISMLFCNRTENHILLKTLFEKLAADNPDRFKIKFCIDSALHPETWTGYTGYVTKQMIRDTMPAPDKKKSIVLLCGPDHLLHHVAGTTHYALNQLSSGKAIQPAGADIANLMDVGGILGSMGYTSDNVYKF